MRFSIHTRVDAAPVATGAGYTPKMLAEFVTANWPSERYYSRSANSRARGPGAGWLMRPVGRISLSVFHEWAGVWLPVGPDDNIGTPRVMTFRRMTEVEAREAIAGAVETLRREDVRQEFFGRVRDQIDDTFAGT